MPESGWEAIGALDDGAYAAALVRHCGDMGYGPRRAREKLREKGVPQELWDEALDELPPDGEQIDRFLQSKLHGRAPEDKEKKRLTDALLRRGFSWGRGELPAGAAMVLRSGRSDPGGYIRGAEDQSQRL